MLTCHNDNLPFNPWSIRIPGNLFQDRNVFEFPLVPNWSYQLLTERCKSSFRSWSHWCVRDQGESNSKRRWLISIRKWEEVSLLSAQHIPSGAGSLLLLGMFVPQPSLESGVWAEAKMIANQKRPCGSSFGFSTYLAGVLRTTFFLFMSSNIYLEVDCN